MRVLVCGDRHWSDYDCIVRYLSYLHRVYGIEQVINGGASGADTMAAMAAHALNIPSCTIHASWSAYGRRAGPIRNGEMLRYQPDLVLAFHERLHESKGTKDMIAQENRAKVPVVHVDNPARQPEDEAWSI